MKLFIGPAGAEPIGLADGVPVLADENGVGRMVEVKGIRNVEWTTKEWNA